MKLDYIIPSNKTQLTDAVNLFKEYASSLNISLDFQNFDKELTIISSMYGSPSGCLFVVYNEKEAIACAAYRQLELDICELKRMYIKPSFRGLGIGRNLLEILCKKALEHNYRLMRLDTLDTMLPAIKLYSENGFYTIDAYYHNPNKGVVYMEKQLTNFDNN